jgi:DNA-binding FrmR family transcriptional regulator/copper chaperone CopZ
MSLELTARKSAALDHVATVRMQLEEVSRMLQSDAYCVDVMKQIQTVQCSLERANRVTLHKHLQTCFSDAVLFGRGQAAIEELIDTVKFTPASTVPHRSLSGSGPGHGAALDTKFMAVTTLSLPGISSPKCKAAIERIVAPITGVGSVEVDLSTRTITIYHDDRAPARRLIEAIEEQGYHTAEPSMAREAARPGIGPGFIDGDGI